MSSVVKCDNPLLVFVINHIAEYPNISNLPIVTLIPMCSELSRLTAGGQEKLPLLADSLESMASILLQDVA